MSSLNLEFGFNVPRRIIYEALIDQQKIMQYTRAPANVKSQQGGEFTMLDGKIVGKFITLRPQEYIKMEWRFNDWKEPSIVEIILQDPEDDECDMVLTQTKIPSDFPKQKMQSGWKHHIVQPMSQILGYPLKD